METARGSESRTKRKTLGDLTNTPSAVAAAAAAASSLLNPKPSRSAARRASGVASRGPENPGCQGIPASPPKAKEVSADPGGDSVTRDKAEDSVVYKRWSAAGRKGKAVAAFISSCPPIGRARNIEKKLHVEDHGVGIPTTLSVPNKKIKKRRRCAVPQGLHKPILPPDFVEQQRAYFAEIDAFELPEEVVSESELE